MKALGPLRKALGFRTIFNLCGPPHQPRRSPQPGHRRPGAEPRSARCPYPLGIGSPARLRGPWDDGIDELTTTGESVVARVEEAETGPPTLKGARVTPEMAGPARARLKKLPSFTGGDVETNASMLYDVLTGIPGPRRDIVLLNAAAALVAAGPGVRPERRGCDGRRGHRLRPGCGHAG